jgi:hypothetical protein
LPRDVAALAVTQSYDIDDGAFLGVKVEALAAADVQQVAAEVVICSASVIAA